MKPKLTYLSFVRTQPQLDLLELYDAINNFESEHCYPPDKLIVNPKIVGILSSKIRKMVALFGATRTATVKDGEVSRIYGYPVEIGDASQFTGEAENADFILIKE